MFNALIPAFAGLGILSGTIIFGFTNSLIIPAGATLALGVIPGLSCYHFYKKNYVKKVEGVLKENSIDDKINQLEKELEKELEKNKDNYDNNLDSFDKCNLKTENYFDNFEEYNESLDDEKNSKTKTYKKKMK